ncbi:hypothetical protein H5410_004734 [Solanum commersonii]|uniref:Uncharacterized protein n=1 Tax=Solanum commersonii TaxID=4109 RepID=A0A9J6A5P2_SOLCO|nr:hypothetical protein H5410_004734 [Solanum commersonii]
MIPCPHIEVNQFKIQNQMQRSHSKRGTQCMFSPIDQKGLSKACNGDKCKCMIANHNEMQRVHILFMQLHLASS